MMEVRSNQLLYTYNHETLCIEPWGDNALRVRATKQSHFPQEDWALTQPHSAHAQITQDQDGASLVNGKIRLHLTKRGKSPFTTSTELSFWKNTAATGGICWTPSAAPLRWKPGNFPLSWAGIITSPPGLNPWTLRKNCTAWDSISRTFSI